jgi:hypothetical protein
VREERENHFIKKQIHQQNVKKVIESQIKKKRETNIKRRTNAESA